ncbi:prepilin-type N-terminal cleavage/methylation domain-containing protein [Pontiellaceae bacterium B12227]|nr:prepilin-type N-terminal cleavage/methylation domain-containing protein [Pontiellaceae bacterium B12227]
MKNYVNSSNAQYKAGTSLIEVMVAMLLLAILVIGTVGSAVRLGDTVAIQGHKRAAIAAAHRRMEEVRSELYPHFHDERVDGINIGNSWVFLSYNGLSFNRHSSDPEEMVNINGVQRAIQTRVRFVSTATGAFFTAECMEIEVTLVTGQGENIELRSFYAN